MFETLFFIGVITIFTLVLVVGSLVNPKTLTKLSEAIF